MNAIVVGNAASLLKESNGKLIDSFDVVIRLNGFVIDGYESHVGTKTNIYCCKWLTMKHNIANVSSYDKIWLPYPKPPNWWTARGSFKEVSDLQHLANIQKYNLDVSKISYLASDRAEEMETIFKSVCQPSTGLIALMMAVQELTCYKIYYTGFDNFSTGWYWDTSHDCIKNMQNSILFEKIFLNYVRTKYGVQKL